MECETLGKSVLKPNPIVDMDNTVIIPSDTLAGDASLLIQNETQDITTTSVQGV